MKRLYFSLIGIITFVGFAALALADEDHGTAWDQKINSRHRFKVLSQFDGAAVLDKETGRVWEQSPSISRFTWNDAQASFHCNNLSVGNRKGWQLPTIQELASLVDGNSTNTSSPRLPSGHPFQHVESSFYWSATTLAFDTSLAWGVLFSDGGVSAVGKTNGSFVWCVRGGQGVDPQ